MFLQSIHTWKCKIQTKLSSVKNWLFLWNACRKVTLPWSWGSWIQSYIHTVSRIQQGRITITLAFLSIQSCLQSSTRRYNNNLRVLEYTSSLQNSTRTYNNNLGVLEYTSSLQSSTRTYNNNLGVLEYTSSLQNSTRTYNNNLGVLEYTVFSPEFNKDV